jgi:hypothetical protein
VFILRPQGVRRGLTAPAGSANPSTKLLCNPPVDIIGHVLALVAGLIEHLAAIPSVVDNRVNDAADAYKDDKSN